jgi:hypothetical protein
LQILLFAVKPSVLGVNYVLAFKNKNVIKLTTPSKRILRGLLAVAQNNYSNMSNF